MFKFDPYNTNPFEQDPEFRLQLKELDDQSVYNLFAKNYVAYIFYSDYEIQISGQTVQKEKQLVFQLFNEGNLNVSNTSMPLLNFALGEIETFKNINTKVSEAYRVFLSKKSNIFCFIDMIYYYMDDPNLIDNTSDFLNSKIDFFELDETIHLIRMYRTSLAQNIINNLTRSIDLENIDYTRMNDVLKNFRYTTEHEFLSESESILFKESIFRGIRQIHKDVNYLLDIDGTLFDKFEENYCRIVNFKNNQKEKEYPLHVFKTYPAYNLFDQYAKRMDVKTAVNYLYRRMYEKDKLILLKDSDFRAWFNEEKYPVKFHESTVTLERSHTPEREVSIDLLYEALGIQ